MTVNSGFVGVGGITAGAGEVERLLSQARSSGTVLSGAALRAVVEWGACRALNEIAIEIYKQSQVEVPEDDQRRDRPGHEILAESALYPGNDADSKAIPARPVAEVSYNAIQAAAQHEGEMVYERNGKTVNWKAHHYTKPGSKKKYLEDPLKAAVPTIDIKVAASIEAALAAFLR